MRIISYLKLLIDNPRIFLKKATLRFFGLFLKFKSPIQDKKINGLSFKFDLSDPNMRKMYLGGYEIETVKILKKILKEGDTFIDVGANIGYLSAIAASCVGKSGQVHSFEPVPNYFSKLKTMADNNKNFNIFVNNFALGDKEKQMEIDCSNDGNIGWNTMVPNLMKKNIIKESIVVPVIMLDNYINDKIIKKEKISLIKIDAEGFEFPILKGLGSFLKEYHPTILCEIVPAAYSLLGTSVEFLYKYMNQFSYQSFDLNYRPLDIRELIDLNYKSSDIRKLTQIQITNVLFKV